MCGLSSLLVDRLLLSHLISSNSVTGVSRHIGLLMKDVGATDRPSTHLGSLAQRTPENVWNYFHARGGKHESTKATP